MKFHSTAALLAAIIAAVGAAGAEQLRGTVVSAGGDPVDDATVAVVELRQQTKTGADGRFEFEVPPGDYLLSVQSTRFGGAVQRVAVSGGAPVEIELVLDQRVHSEGITVTATGVARGLDEIVLPVDVLGDVELTLRRASTLGETLAQQPGVTSTSYGQGASRPVIRGLGADRIRVLENGLDSGDVASIGPDHAVSSDPLAAERIEVVRGPATLLYGPNAVGGLVNVIDGRVPDRANSQPVTGTVELEAGSNADKRSGAVTLDGGTGAVAWHVDFYARDQDDYESPAPRQGDEEEDEHEGEEPEHLETGTVENSFSKAQGGAAGVSYIADRGFIGVAVSGFDSEYGVPGHGHGHHEEGEKQDENETFVSIDLEQRRLDLLGQLDFDGSAFQALRLGAGWRDYEHVELEGDEVGTRFENQFTEARIDALNRPWGPFDGTLGLHWSNRDFGAFGEEAFVQPTETRKLALYVYQQSRPQPVGFQFGLRFENQDTRTSDVNLPDRDFSTVSASVGVLGKLSKVFTGTLSLSRSERAPTPEELYSDGPHAATFSYEVGDPELSTEVGNGVDLTLRADAERFEGTLSLYATRYDGFVFLADTGEQIEGFEVRRYVQGNADFWGFELHGDVELVHAASKHLHLEFAYDLVRAELRELDEYLPRIPPQSGRLALVFVSQRWDGRVEGLWVDDQTRTAPNETPTPGYEMLNASVGYKIFAGAMMHQILLRGTNLTDESAYNAVSFLKFQAPLPGRTVSLIYRFLF